MVTWVTGNNWGNISGNISDNNMGVPRIFFGRGGEHFKKISNISEKISKNFQKISKISKKFSKNFLKISKKVLKNFPKIS